ncbi:MAG: small multi-drug export protein [Candidatus Omnitrophica bacterium]|nr:small multi-drug export protein [Candidatus Omnitrophota bacterium]
MIEISLPSWIVALPDEIKIAGVAALPIFELRGAIPIGCNILGISAIGKVYFLSILGNLVPVLPLLLFFKYFFHHLENIKFIGKFFKWWFCRVEKKSKLIERWGFWGLVLFVAIPLPVTGAWTGTVAANLFEIKVKRAFLAILLGVVIAGVIVSLIVSGIVQLWFSSV